jgi:hypothetical protein
MVLAFVDGTEENHDEVRMFGLCASVLSRGCPESKRGVLSKQCIFVILMGVGTSSSYFHIQHYLIDFYN